MMKRLNKKGFSIVEVVIAMTVIAIVSATALSIVASSSNNTSAAMYKVDAQYLVYDALECFKASSDHEEFAAAFQFRGNVVPLDQDPRLEPLPASEENENGEENQDTGDGGSDENTENNSSLIIAQYYMIKDSRYLVCVSMEYGKSASNDPSLNTRDIFSIYVINSDNEVVAAITDYQKINIGGS